MVSMTQSVIWRALGQVGTGLNGSGYLANPPPSYADIDILKDLITI